MALTGPSVAPFRCGPSSRSAAMTTGADRQLPASRKSSKKKPALDPGACEGLPAFNKPLVIEVATSLQFNPINGLDAARLGFGD